MKRVINFSGGKTSALMTILLKPTENDIVLFTDTGREHPLTYKFIDDFERNENIKVHRAEYTHKKAPGLKGFDALIESKKFVPNRMQRFCTSELKILVAKRYLRSLGIITFENYIGFRADEERRVNNYKNKYKRVLPKFPLFDKGVNKEMVNQYWLTRSYTLEIPSILGNCDLCFLKGKDNIIKIMQHFPELAQRWIDDETKVKDKGHKNGKATYFGNISYAELFRAAQSQKSLFDLQDALPAYDCSCSVI
jgi:hypothetical protein